MRIWKRTCCKSVLYYVTLACTIASLQCAEGNQEEEPTGVSRATEDHCLYQCFPRRTKPDRSTSTLKSPAANPCDNDEITEYNPARLYADAEQSERRALKCNGAIAKLGSQPKSTRRLHFSVFKKDQPRVLGATAKASSAPGAPAKSADAPVRNSSSPSEAGRAVVAATRAQPAPAPSGSVPEVKGAPMAGVAREAALATPPEKESVAVKPSKSAPGPNLAPKGKSGFWSWFWKREKVAEGSERGVHAGGTSRTLPVVGAVPAGAPAGLSEDGAEEAARKAGNRKKAAEAASILQLGSRRAQPTLSREKSLAWGPGAPGGLPGSVGVPSGGVGRKGLPAGLALPLPGTLASTAIAGADARKPGTSGIKAKESVAGTSKAGKIVGSAAPADVSARSEVKGGKIASSGVKGEKAGSVEVKGGGGKDVGAVGGANVLAQSTEKGVEGLGREMKETRGKAGLKKEKKKKKGGKKKEGQGMPVAENVVKKKKNQKKKRAEKVNKEKGKPTDLLLGKSGKSSARRRRSQLQEYAYSRQDAVTRCGEATLEAHNHRRAHLKKYE